MILLIWTYLCNTYLELIIGKDHSLSGFFTNKLRFGVCNERQIDSISIDTFIAIKWYQKPSHPRNFFSRGVIGIYGGNEVAGVIRRFGGEGDGRHVGKSI